MPVPGSGCRSTKLPLLRVRLPYASPGARCRGRPPGPAGLADQVECSAPQAVVCRARAGADPACAAPKLGGHFRASRGWPPRTSAPRAFTPGRARSSSARARAPAPWSARSGGPGRPPGGVACGGSATGRPGATVLLRARESPLVPSLSKHERSGSFNVLLVPRACWHVVAHDLLEQRTRDRSQGLVRLSMVRWQPLGEGAREQSIVPAVHAGAEVNRHGSEGRRYARAVHARVRMDAAARSHAVELAVTRCSSYPQPSRHKQRPTGGRPGPTGRADHGAGARA